MKSNTTESRYEDDEQCSCSDRVFTTITSLAFTILAAMDLSYPAGTTILTRTFVTLAGIWQVFRF
jgi:hypothetical protein